MIAPRTVDATKSYGNCPQNSHWIGRLRGKLYLAWQTQPDAWVCLLALYERATRRAARLDLAQIVRSRPIQA